MRKFLFGLFLALACSAGASAQTLCQWRDTLTNSIGQVIPGATVIVLAGTVGGSAAVNTNTQPGTPLATIYADPYGLVPINQATNPINTASGDGTFQFWGTCGLYVVIQAYGAQIAGQYVYGTQLSSAGSGTCPTCSIKPTTVNAIQYITSNGNDSDDGFSWGTAKLSIASACAALPGGNSSCSSGSGQIMLAPGVLGIFLPGGASPTINLSWQEYNGGTNGATTGGLVTSGPVPWVDIRSFGGHAWSNAPPTITVTSPGSSPTVTTTGVSDFIPGDGIAIPQAGSATSQTTPSAPTVNSIGATGSSTINYKCVGIDQKWGLTAASSAGTTTSAPTVFGQGAVAISSIARSSNVVTVTTSTALPFASGATTYHATIAAVTGGTTNFTGLFLVTVTGTNTLTYSQTGSDESGTVTAGTSYVLFENAFILTTVQATAGSNQLVLTTDVNHNIVQQQSGVLDTILYLDGISFSGMPVQGYANGPFPIVSVTSNTITIRTPWVATATTTGTASATFSTAKGALQMTATVWPEQEVVCPALAGTTMQYAVYADYGSGYAPIGFTTWTHNIFLDYGPAFTKTGFVPPSGMQLPATPPVSAQNQIFSGQVASVSGSTLTLTANVPTAVTSQTAYHDNGVPFLNAINYSCQATVFGGNNRTFFPVYFAPTSSSTYYFFHAPVDMSNTPNTCNRIKLLIGGALWLNGTWTASNALVYMKRPDDIAGANVTVTENTVGLGIYVFGYASPMMGGSKLGLSWQVKGLVMDTLSNGQNAFVNTGADSRFDDFACVPNGQSQLSSTCFVNSGTQEETIFHNFNFGGVPNLGTPLTPAGVFSGQVTWWPVPAVLIEGSQFQANESNLILEGHNNGNGTGFQWSNLIATQPSTSIEFDDVQTFQEPYQPLLLFRGTGGQPYLLMKDVQTDSVQQPILSSIVGGGGNNAASVITFYNAGIAQAGAPLMTGNPAPRVQVISNLSTTGQAQNTNENYQSPGGWAESGPAKINCNATSGNTTNALTVYDNTNTAVTSIGCPGGAIVAASIVDGLTHTVVTTSASPSLADGYSKTIANNQEATAAAAVTYTLPTAVAGLTKCVINSNNGSAADTGVLTLQTSASGQYIIFTDGTLSASGGYVSSGGAAADNACVQGVDATHWQLFVQSGTWAKH